MPLPRQLPKLCLRGSLANITMANITPQERERINNLTIQIANHPELQPKRTSIIKNYAATIGGDYHDRSVADNEYLISIWRGVVNLFYHRKYTFRCAACGEAHYTTKRNRIAPIDRQQLVCPNCGQVKVSNAGATGLAVGQFISYDEFENIASQFPDGQAPSCQTPIEYIPGDRIYQNPEDLLADKVQVRKFFGEVSWNYVRQQIRENARVEHKKDVQTITGRADEIIFQELISLCRKMKLDCRYDLDLSTYKNKTFDVCITGLLTPPEFSAELALLRKRALQNDVVLFSEKNCVCVLKDSSAPFITGKVSMPEHVMYHEECGNDQDGFTIGQLWFKTRGGERMEPDDHVKRTDIMDVLEAIRRALPDGTCQAVFDIVSGQGDTYKAFSDEYGDSSPRKCQIAEFLRVPHRVVGVCRQQIKINCLLHGFEPGAVS